MLPTVISEEGRWPWSGGLASVETSVLGIDMLENQGQSILFLFEKDFEAVLRIELLARFKPGKSRFFAGSHFTFTTFK